MDVFGIPAHPLIVHAAVVLVPLAALGALALMLVARWRRTYGWLTATFAVAGFAAALAAKSSGEAFAAERGMAGTPRISAHEAWGGWAPWPALVLAIGVVALVWLTARPEPRRGPMVWTAVALTAAGALASLVVVAITGHLGATAVWG